MIKLICHQTLIRYSHIIYGCINSSAFGSELIEILIVDFNPVLADISTDSVTILYVCGSSESNGNLCLCSARSPTLETKRCWLAAAAYSQRSNPDGVNCSLENGTVP